MAGSEAIDRSVPHAARIYDYLLGGTSNFPVDRRAAEATFADLDGGIEVARAEIRANRLFLGRVVRYLAGEAGIRQFLDIGTGIPNADNVHAVARSVAPDARVVYVDNDPSVLAHADELLADDGATTFVDADLRRPAKILREAGRALDLDRPVAIVLIAVLHFVADEDRPYDAVARLLDAVPSGSYLALSHEEPVPGLGYGREAVRRIIRAYNERTSETMVARSVAELGRFLDGLEPVGPGLVPVAAWRPDGSSPPLPFLGAVARKP